MKLDEDWSKQKILASYLNSVFYGNLAYGAEAASRTYFSRPARWLTLPQAALLAGLTQAPSIYDPLADPAARSRGATRCSRRCWGGDDHRARSTAGRAGSRSASAPGSSTSRSASRTSSGTSATSS